MSDAEVITLYGNTWCGGSRRARLLFDRKNIPYVFIDIDKDEAAAKYVESVKSRLPQRPDHCMGRRLHAGGTDRR